jgi:hypothetical protein
VGVVGTLALIAVVALARRLLPSPAQSRAGRHRCVGTLILSYQRFFPLNWKNSSSEFLALVQKRIIVQSLQGLRGQSPRRYVRSADIYRKVLNFLFHDLYKV